MRLVVLSLVLMVAGCGPVGEAIQNPGQATTQTVSTSQQSIDQVQLEAYDGPKARVAVYRFGDQTAKGGGAYNSRRGWYSAEIGNGMSGARAPLAGSRARICIRLLNSSSYRVKTSVGSPLR